MTGSHHHLNTSKSASKMSARDYLSEHTGYDRDDRKIFRLILRSSENRAKKLIEFLKEAKGRLDLTAIIDRHGYTPLIFSIFKERIYIKQRQFVWFSWFQRHSTNSETI